MVVSAASETPETGEGPIDFGICPAIVDTNGPPGLIQIGCAARPLQVSHMRRTLSLRRSSHFLSAIALAALSALAFSGTLALAADAPTLGTAANYAVMAATAITNTGSTVVDGNLAISPGGSSSVTGFPPGVVTGAMDAANADAVQAHTDLVGAYNDAAGETTTVNLTGTDLGGLTLTPGTYTFDSSAQLTGTLTLDGQGSTNAAFIFQIGSTLTTASNSTVTLINGAGGCAVFWQVGSSATLGTTTDFQGTIMAMTSITMTTGATIGVGGLGYGGRALAMNGAVTLDSNVITPPPAGCTFAAAPTPTATPAPSATITPAPSATITPAPSATTSPAAALPDTSIR
jgi:type VI secretion system secreted protein VgrG